MPAIDWLILIPAIDWLVPIPAIDWLVPIPVFDKTHETVLPITLHHPMPNSATLAYLLLKEWNHLPTEIIEQKNLNLFTDKLSYYY